MKATETLTKVKELLGLSEEVQLAQATLENGTVIEAEEMSAGKEVFIVTEEMSERVPLPVGEYALEDGQMLKVEEEGIIASIGAAEEPAEEEVEAEEVEAAEEEEMSYATKQELAEVKEMIKEIKAMIKDKEEMSEVVEDAKEELQEEEVKEELSAQEPVEKVKHNPEAETKKALNLYGQKRPSTTMDKVLSRISQINK